jgi:hypothetical protein
MRRITESELNRLTRVINESMDVPNLREDMDSLRMFVRTLGNSVDDFEMNQRKGNYKQMSDDLEMIRVHYKRLRNVLERFESKIYRN